MTSPTHRQLVAEDGHHGGDKGAPVVLQRQGQHSSIGEIREGGGNSMSSAGALPVVLRAWASVDARWCANGSPAANPSVNPSAPGGAAGAHLLQLVLGLGVGGGGRHGVCGQLAVGVDDLVHLQAQCKQEGREGHWSRACGVCGWVAAGGGDLAHLQAQCKPAMRAAWRGTFASSAAGRTGEETCGGAPVTMKHLLQGEVCTPPPQLHVQWVHKKGFSRQRSWRVGTQRKDPGGAWP